MGDDSSQTIQDKLISAVGGFFTGVLYGLILAIVVSYISKSPFNSRLIGWSSVVFAGIGFFRGAIVFDAFLGLLHFFWGYVNGTYKPLVGHTSLEATEPTRFLFKNIMWIGFATGLIVYCARRQYF